MAYESLDLEWDETWHEMHEYAIEEGDKVLCLTPEVQVGEVVEAKACSYMVRLEDGSVDEIAAEDVLKRKAA